MCQLLLRTVFQQLRENASTLESTCRFVVLEFCRNMVKWELTLLTSHWQPPWDFARTHVVEFMVAFLAAVAFPLTVDALRKNRETAEFWHWRMRRGSYSLWMFMVSMAYYYYYIGILWYIAILLYYYVTILRLPYYTRLPLAKSLFSTWRLSALQLTLTRWRESNAAMVHRTAQAGRSRFSDR